MEEFGRQVLGDLWSGVLRDERYIKEQRVASGWHGPDTEPRDTDESQPVPRDLWGKIVSPAKPEPKNPLDAEGEQMEAFAAARLRWQGRTRELRQIADFFDATTGDAQRLAVVVAPGQGKSSHLAISSL
jgi:hypothetical protein